MLHIYEGDGKGKTTAAVGLAVRAAGCGRRVLFAQLLKGAPSGEIGVLGQIPGITVRRLDRDYGFTFQMDDATRAHVTALHDALIAEATAFAQADGAALLVLDELLPAWSLGMVDRDAVLRLLDTVPERCEIVLTGHADETCAPLLARADYHTHLGAVRHPYEKGIPAREGIEY